MIAHLFRKPAPPPSALSARTLTGPRCELCTRFEPSDLTCRRHGDAPSGVPRQRWPHTERGSFCSREFFRPRPTVSPEWLRRWWLDGFDVAPPPGITPTPNRRGAPDPQPGAQSAGPQAR